MNLEKNQVKQWSRIGALVLTISPLVLRSKKELEPALKKQVWLLLILFAIITYWTYYYTLSSLFWPEPLSITNHLLLIPCVVLTGVSIYSDGQELLSKN